MSFVQFNLASMVHVIVIAVYRYLAVAFPHGGLAVQSKRFIIALLVGIHTSLLALTVLPKISKIHKLYFNVRVGGCMLSVASRSDLFFLGLFYGGTLLTGSVVLVVYQRIRTIMTHNPAMPTTVYSMQRQRGHLNIVVCMALVLMVVFLSYMVLSVLVGIEMIGAGKVHSPEELGFLGICMMWMANSSNWIIYGLFNRGFRQAYKQLLSRRCGTHGQVHPSPVVAFQS